MRPKIFAGNWKMNLNPKEALNYFIEFKKHLSGNLSAHIVIFPVAYALSEEHQKQAREAQVELGAQNIHWEERGAFTGELSASHLLSMGIHWTLIGHSERRQYFNETDQTASKRFGKAASLEMNVIYCIGEKLEQRESNQTEEVLTLQTLAFAEILKKFPSGKSHWCIAYEPVWAIGTGKTATCEQAESAHRFIRKIIWDKLGLEAAQKLPILYGGSVTPDNARELLAQPNIDGVLVGGASLKPETFVRIVTSL